MSVPLYEVIYVSVVPELVTCPYNWETFEGHCYKFIQSTRAPNWDEARMSCGYVIPGAHLVSIGTRKEMDFIINIVNNSSKRVWWTSGRYNTANSSWLWDDGKGRLKFNP